MSVKISLGVDKNFTVRFPVSPLHTTRLPETFGAKPATGVPDSKEITPNIHNPHVLVVDDEPLVAGMLRMFLESSGHNASVYLEGEETVTSFRAGAFD